jgi:ABC-type multidrug transport system ATPase subunit
MELRIENLSKTYPNGVRALRDVTLTIPRGMFGLLGPNGAGKSSLMRTIATLQEPDSGSVELRGVGSGHGPNESIDVLREKDRVRRTLGYLPQEFGVYPSVTAERLLDHFAVLEGFTDRAARRRTVEALLRQTNLWDVRNQRLGGYSGGMRQRFGIAVALLGDPSLIIVDEPTAGLDPAERVRFLNLLSEIGENSVVILSTHIVEDVAELCPRMAIIDRGEILLEAEPLAAIAALHGRVWKRIVAKQELPAIEREHRLICTKLQAGRTLVHVYADTRPGPEFEPVEPELEDVYFSVMAGHHGARAAHDRRGLVTVAAS